VGGGDNLGGEVEPLAEVFNTFRSQDIVVPLPGELGLDETAGGQALESLDDLEVRYIELLVLGGVEVLLGDKYALLEEVLIDDAPVLLGDDHAGPMDLFTKCDKGSHLFPAGGENRASDDIQNFSIHPSSSSRPIDTKVLSFGSHGFVDSNGRTYSTNFGDGSGEES
jgi:hypothetical protein